MSIELRIAGAQGVEHVQDGSFASFCEAMRAGIRLAHALGEDADYKPDKAIAVRLYSGGKRVLTITIVRGGLHEC